MITFLQLLTAFVCGYITYPLYKAWKIFRIAKQIDNTMKSIYAEHAEIRDILNEVDKDWHKKHDGN